jgi:hypothetical protein
MRKGTIAEPARAADGYKSRPPAEAAATGSTRRGRLTHSPVYFFLCKLRFQPGDSSVFFGYNQRPCKWFMLQCKASENGMTEKIIDSANLGATLSELVKTMTVKICIESDKIVIMPQKDATAYPYNCPFLGMFKGEELIDEIHKNRKLEKARQS